VVEDGRVHEEDASREAGGWLALAARLLDTLLIHCLVIYLISEITEESRLYIVTTS
jgi:hypothetical protein